MDCGISAHRSRIMLSRKEQVNKRTAAEPAQKWDTKPRSLPRKIAEQKSSDKQKVV